LGQRLAVKIERMGINGEGIGYFKRRLIFVAYGLPDEELTVEITENQRNFSRARIVTIDKKSSDRVEPADRAYAELSESHIMHLAYDKQLAFKRDVIRQALYRYKPRGYQGYELRETLAADKQLAYRNKLQFQIRKLKNGRVIAGLYKENSHHLVSLTACQVENSENQALINEITRQIENLRLPVYDERKIMGIRTVVIRRAEFSGQIQVTFVLSKELHLETLVENLTKKFPAMTNVFVNIHPRKSSEIFGEKTFVLWRNELAKDTITERVSGNEFELSPRAFFQLNTAQAEKLYAEVVRALAPTKQDRVIDAYCGVGTIGFAVAKKVKSVHGMDIIPEAINDARDNARALGFKNCHYEIGKAEVVIANMFKSGHKPTALIVDPPRTGLDDALLDALVKNPPAKMVYVSCNASTLAKDLVALTDVYNVSYIQSVDMFPHTARVEAVVKLEARK
jgi:23S rRNA (uracil-5-)-methyltransferase RumA